MADTVLFCSAWPGRGIETTPTKAGGRAKTNMHVMGKGDPITRVGLTAMQIMGLPIDAWGTQSLRTSKSISEVMA